MRIECEFEADVLAAAMQGRWPEHMDAELRAHVETCPVCADVAVAAGAIERVREQSVHIPDAGRVWWLAQLRARREAAETAGTPITAVQVIAFALGAGLVGACFGATSTWFQSALQWIVSLRFAAAEALIATHSLLAVGMAAVLFLIPLAVWLAMGRD